MGTATLLMVLAIAGVNFGWQSAGDGSAGYEYIVQVEPELVDAMQRGDSIPIESNIPADVTPIRKVRVVVGRGDVPRTPIRHTANFAGQGGWAPDRYPAGSAPPAADRYTAQGQSVLDRAQTAATETGSAISDGVQAGMRSAQEQFSRTGSQVASDTQNAAQQFGQQMQAAGTNVRNATEQTFDATGNQIRQAGNSLGLTSGTTTTGAGGVSAPPWTTPTNTAPSVSGTSAVQPPPGWPGNSATARSATVDTTASPGMAVTRTANGWSSIGPNVAAPPLLNPPMATPTDSNSNVRVAQGTSATGPSLGAPASATNREQYHSVLVDPARQSANTNAGTNDWGSGWGAGAGAAATAAAPATIGRAGEAASATGTAPVQPRYPSQQNTQQAADRWGDPWAEKDPWTQQQQQQQIPAPPTVNGTTANAGQMATNSGWPTGTSTSANTAANVNTAPGQPVIGRAQPSTNMVGFPANPGLQGGVQQANGIAGTNLAGANTGAIPGAQATQVPWMPLLLVTLGLVGSLSANFYLVLSYLGARQKYVSLVQRTADTFRRATGAAAAA